jgi:hypothetical protein
MKNLITSLFILAIAAATPFTATAQTDMLWDSWGLAFTLERGMKITENNGEAFTAERDDLFLTISPVEDAWTDEDDLADAVILMMEEMDFDRISDADEMEMNDLYGYYIEGKKDGAMAVVMALMDQESDRNFLLALVFTAESRDAAIRIAQSMYAYDGE